MRLRHLVAGLVALTALLATALATPAQAATPCGVGDAQPRCGYRISYTDGMGVAHRSGPWNDARTGQPGIVAGAHVRLWCYAWGDPVGSNGNRLWWNVETDDGRGSWVSDHWLNTPVPTNPPFFDHPCL